MPDERELLKRLESIVASTEALAASAKDLHDLGTLGEALKHALGEPQFLELLYDFYRQAKEVEKEGLKLYFGPTPLTVLELPSQDLLILQRRGVTTIPQLFAISPLEIVDMKNFGSTRAHRLIHRLAAKEYLPRGTTMYYLLEKYPSLSLFEARIRIERERR